MAEIYHIIYNDTPLDINPQYFADASSVFARHYQPDNPGEMTITSEMPVEFFRQFLPAVQRQRVTLSEQNIDAMRSLARDWDVPSLIESCDRWENGTEVLLRRFINAHHDKNFSRCEELVPIIAARIDEFIRLERFMLIDPKFLHDIITHSECHATDQHELLKVIMGIIQLRTSRCSALLNTLVVDELSDDELELVMSNDKIDRGAAVGFITKVTLRFLRTSRSVSSEIHRFEVECKRAEQQRNQKLTELKMAEQRLSDEKVQHKECVRQLNGLYERYEPGHPRATANRPPPRRPESGKSQRAPPPPPAEVIPPQVPIQPRSPFQFVVAPPPPPEVAKPVIAVEKPRRGREAPKIIFQKPGQ
jgi:hypothetical protein